MLSILSPRILGIVGDLGPLALGLLFRLGVFWWTFARSFLVAWRVHVFRIVAIRGRGFAVCLSD